MTIAYSLSAELRVRLKRPLGTLVRGSFVETMREFGEMVREEKPPRIVSVGDTVSKNLEKNQIFPQLSIIDNKAMRRTTKPFSSAVEKTLYVKNPKATIMAEAITAIRDSLRDNSRVRIVVDGEEDLLALIAVLYAPENSFVVYGQPYEGIVVIKTTRTKKAEVAGILASMENSRKAK
jgi:uncharacterized protein (UPF0218 family)